MDPVTFAIGGAVAKWAFKLWAGDGAAVDLTTDLAGIVGRKISDPFQRRSVTRQFESLADEIARRLDPYLSREITGLDESERQAVCLAAQETIDASLLDLSSLLTMDLDPGLIKKHMLENDPERKHKYAFSAAGDSMYETLLTEVSGYISASASSLPGFSSQQTAELLSRDSLIISMLVEVLDKMPKSAAPSTWDSASNDLLFENEYRKSIFRHADKLQLFGVSSRLEKSSYSLSVAYISMSVSSDKVKSENGMLSDGSTGASNWKNDRSDYVSVEEALSSYPYVLVSGGAGSGKTTLVQWLAASAAKASFSGPLESWNGNVPFILPLRRFVTDPLPSPEDFVAPIAAPIAGAMPAGWVHRIMSSGRALILVDGLDEVPAEKREETTNWLENLIEFFPDNRFIITSRSTALSNEIVKNDRFAHASLLPMEYTDIKQFVAHWHAAALKDVSSVEEKESIRESERLILATIRDRSSIRSLCNSPLLCALICALNRDRAGSIPENRMELYDTALQMLVVRRDEARRVSGMEAVTLSYKESEVLLRSFALWLHENGHADAEKSEFERRIGKELAYLIRTTASKEEVAQHLLVRSGVLREPVPGRVDFVHRTFLEYLAAAALVDDDSIAKLILHAHEDHWREVVIMAAGHARLKDREELIRGLISRGKEDANLTHRLYLLAVACMETSTDLSPALQAELKECLEEVIPPRNMTDAAAVASAGSIAIPLLEGFQGYATESAACVRALVMIGGDAALSALEHFGRDSRVTVARELIRGWSYFDAEAYATRVLARSPLDNGLLRIRDAEYLRFIDRIPRLKSVIVDSQARAVDFAEFPSSDLVWSIYLSPASQFADLESLSRYPGLFSLSLRNCSVLNSLDGLDNLSEVAYVDVEGCANLVDISALRNLEGLKMLDLSRTGITSISTLPHGSPLDVIYLQGCRNLRDLGDIVPAAQIVIGDMQSLVDYSAFSRSTDVRKLNLRAFVHAFPDFELPPNLLELFVTGPRASRVWGAPDLESVSFIAQEDASYFVDFVESHLKVGRAVFSSFSAGTDFSSLLRLEAHPTLNRLIIHSSEEKIQELPELSGFTAERRRARVIYQRADKPSPEV